MIGDSMGPSIRNIREAINRVRYRDTLNHFVNVGPPDARNHNGSFSAAQSDSSVFGQVIVNR